jgi:hypothetical protein
MEILVEQVTAVILSGNIYHSDTWHCRVVVAASIDVTNLQKQTGNDTVEDAICIHLWNMYCVSSSRRKNKVFRERMRFVRKCYGHHNDTRHTQKLTNTSRVDTLPLFIMDAVAACAIAGLVSCTSPFTTEEGFNTPESLTTNAYSPSVLRSHCLAKHVSLGNCRVIVSMPCSLLSSW